MVKTNSVQPKSLILDEKDTLYVSCTNKTNLVVSRSMLCQEIGGNDYQMTCDQRCKLRFYSYDAPPYANSILPGRRYFVKFYSENGDCMIMPVKLKHDFKSRLVFFGLGSVAMTLTLILVIITLLVGIKKKSPKRYGIVDADKTFERKMVRLTPERSPAFTNNFYLDV